MHMKALNPGTEAVVVAKADLLKAWATLEKTVVSLRRMGTHFAVPESPGDQAAEERHRMLDALDAFFGPEMVRELGHARRLLSEYLPDEETERVSETGILYWAPQDAAAR